MQQQHRTRALYALGLAAVFALGYAAAGGGQGDPLLASGQSAEKAAYLVVSSRVVDPEPAALAAYAEAAGPGAQRAGIEVLAQADADALRVLEGEWPHAGGVTIERFTSMQALLDFWHSDEYQAAIPLRQGAVDIDFIVALEATAPPAATP